jgi:hypothetical protein
VRKSAWHTLIHGVHDQHDSEGKSDRQFQLRVFTKQSDLRDDEQGEGGHVSVGQVKQKHTLERQVNCDMILTQNKFLINDVKLGKIERVWVLEWACIQVNIILKSFCGGNLLKKNVWFKNFVDWIIKNICKNILAKKARNVFHLVVFSSKT